MATQPHGERIDAVAKLTADRLMHAIECIEDALAVYDADDRLVLCNGAYRELVGALLPGALVGKRYSEILDACIGQAAFASDDERASFQAQRLADRHAPEPKCFDVHACDGRRYRVSDRRTAECGIVQTIWDLTEDVEREEELREAHRVANAASVAKSEFVTTMSFELRTRLNAMLGFAQLLDRDGKTPPADRHRERVRHILAAGEHLLRLIDDVLDLARVEAGRVPISLEPLALANVLAEVQSTLDPIASRAEIELVMEPVERHIPEVLADRTRLKQILMSYGSNAIMYGRKAGKAVFRISESRGFVRVSVIDDGIGIGADKQDKIFQPFQRAAHETGSMDGSGIGLALSKRLAELMDGSVGFQSVDKQGSEFWIDLPAHRAGPA